MEIKFGYDGRINGGVHLVECLRIPALNVRAILHLQHTWHVIRQVSFCLID